MSDISRGYDAIKKAGLYGTAKSAFYSMKHTDSFTKLVLHSKVIPEIAEETEFDINGRLLVGTKKSSGSHRRMTRSKFLTRPGSKISHTGEKHAKIGPGSILHLNGHFSIGDSYINGYSRIMCDDRLTIGDGCAVSWGVHLMDTDGHRISYDGELQPKMKPVMIEDDVWIGHSATITKGVTVHTGSVVASDSVVTSDVPAHTLVGGNPAEVIRENVSWEA